MKKICLLLSIVFYTHAFQPPLKPLLVPKTKPAPAQPKKSIKQLIEEDKARKKEVYYDAAHLRELDQKKIQKHAPMLIIIDELQEETEVSDSIAMTEELSYAIKRQLYPVLVTASVLRNLLVRMDPKVKQQSEKNNEIQEFTPQITAQNWKIFNVPNSQFVLLVPVNFLNIYGSNLGIKPLPELTNLMKDPSNFILKAWLDKKKKIIPFSKIDLEKVFVSKSDNTGIPTWDFIVAGHGLDNPPIIANLKPATINEMFHFFDTKIKTGIVLIISCYAGGSNRKLLETTQAGIQINHNFVLILGSVANETVTVTYPKDYDYANLFFNNAAQIQDKGASFDILWEDLAQAKIFSSKESVHGLENIPQVWFPGGVGFQSANIPDLVFPLGNVLLKKHKENNEPIIIIGDALVLIYPTVIDVPLIVYPTSVSNALNKKSWVNIPHVFEPSFTENNFELAFSQQNQNRLGLLIDYLLVPRMTRTVGTMYLDALQHLLLDSLYPKFISLNTTGSGHLFKEINVENVLFDESSRIKAYGLGVLHFIRDAFLDVGLTSQPSIYFIDKLSGFNDISLVLEGSRMVRRESKKNLLEEYLQNLIDQNIILENVMILINNGGLKFTIYFAIGDTYWQYTSAQAEEDAKTSNWWNFRLMGDVRSSYDKDYQKYKNQLVQKPESINQKSISAILDEKHRQERLKQIIELQKKQEAISKGKKTVLPQPKTRPAPVIPTKK